MTSSYCCTRLMALLASLYLVACATTPVSPLQLDQARMALKVAVDAGAEANAPIEFRAARDRLDQAVRAADDRDGQLASVLAEQSQLNSELAVVRIAAAQARDAERRAREENQRLERDLRELFAEEQN